MVRTSAALNGTPISYAYNTRNQLTGDGTHTFSYDKNGNRISDGTLTTVWDRAGRMLSHDGHSYAYDGEGRRIAQTAGGSTTRYVLDVKRGLPAVIGAKAGSDVTHYMHGPLGMFAQRNPDATWDWMLHDGLGSVRGVFDGTLQSAAEYDPFGEPIVAPMGTAYGFTGELTDGNGLVYLRARYLAPGLGTFASRDPWRGSASAPRTWNGFAWVEGNVVNRVDPGGMQSCISSGGDGLFVSPQVVAPISQASTGPTIAPVPTPPQANTMTPTPPAPGSLSENPTVALTMTPTAGGTTQVPIDLQFVRTLVDDAYQCLTSAECNSARLGRRPEDVVDALALVVEMTAERYGADRTREILDAVSWIVVGVGGSETALWGGLKTFLELPIEFHDINNLGVGFHPDYFQPETQPVHVWAYLNTVAQGGMLVFPAADIVHECLGGEGVIQDARLSTAAFKLGMLGQANVPAPVFAEIFRETLQSPFNGELLPWYSNWVCRYIVE